MRDEDWRGKSKVGTPETFQAAVLSYVAYQGKTKSLGWHGIPAARQLPEEKAETFRVKLSQGKSLNEDELSSLRQSFWLEDLQEVVFDEVKLGGMSLESREDLALKLWSALFVQPFSPPNFKKKLTEIGQTGAEIDGDGKEAGLSRDGVWRSNDVHCMLFAKVWEPVNGFDSDRVWVAVRGTENKARALSSGTMTFLRDYAADLYRNFAKSWRKDYHEAYMALGDAISEMPENQRPKEIVHCGHSFGGAMATEAFMQGSDRMERLGVKSSAITFGSPGSGEMGVATAAVALGGLGAFAAIGAARWAIDAVGLGGVKGGLHKELSGAGLLARQVFNAAFGALAWMTTTGPLWMLNAASQTVSNKIDAWRTGKREFDRAGYLGFRTDSASKRALEDGRLTHFKHVGDAVAAVGDVSGFGTAGEDVYMRPSIRGSLNPVAEHAMGLYAKSAIDRMVSTGFGNDPALTAYMGCLAAVDQMVAQQAKLHAQSKLDGTEMHFVRQQLRSSTYRDEQEAPDWARKNLARVNGAISRQKKLIETNSEDLRRRREAASHPGPLVFRALGKEGADLSGFQKIVACEGSALQRATEMIAKCGGKTHFSTSNDQFYDPAEMAARLEEKKVALRGELADFSLKIKADGTGISESLRRLRNRKESAGSAPPDPEVSSVKSVKLA